MLSPIPGTAVSFPQAPVEYYLKFSGLCQEKDVGTIEISEQKFYNRNG